MDINEYSDLADTGHEGREPTKPEDEFFHSVYIAGVQRKNHAQIVEQPGLLQIRGVEYNLTEVNMIITHTKEVLVKAVHEKNRESIKCFSFKDGPAPWYGTSRLQDGSRRVCPLNSEERAVNEFCNPCRSQLIVAGIYCDSNGNPVINDNKPVFVFIRGKGIKYSNVSEYLSDLFKMDDLEPIFTPVTEESQKFEKAVVNHKRFVTKITKGTALSSYGEKNVFVLKAGAQLEKKTVEEILRVAKKTKDKFQEKFDWARGAQTTGYTQPQARPEGVLSVAGDQETQADAPSETTQDATPSEPASQPISFEDLDFGDKAV
jgi:hypothetical protein